MTVAGAAISAAAIVAVAIPESLVQNIGGSPLQNHRHVVKPIDRKTPGVTDAHADGGTYSCRQHMTSATSP
jgi:hypothetical protein